MLKPCGAKIVLILPKNLCTKAFCVHLKQKHYLRFTCCTKTIQGNNHHNNLKENACPLAHLEIAFSLGFTIISALNFTVTLRMSVIGFFIFSFFCC